MNDRDPALESPTHTWQVQLVDGRSIAIVAGSLRVTDSGALVFYSRKTDDAHIVNVVSPAAYVMVDKRS